jgi:hypothetical protein
MEPLTLLATQCGGYAFEAISSFSVSAQSLGGIGSGIYSGLSNSQSFSFTNGPLGFALSNSLGKQYSLRPDLISAMINGSSWNIFQHGQVLGRILFDPTTNSFTSNGNIDSGLMSSLTASLASSRAF